MGNPERGVDSRGSASDIARDISSRISSQIIKKAVEELCARLGLTEKEVLQLLKERKDTVQIPVSIFSNKALSGLELVCKYLKDELGIRISDIARLLSRDYRTVWTTYFMAGRKLKARLSVPKSDYFFPTLILTDRKLSVLEAIVAYLKDELGLRFSEVARALHRDQRNVWTVYSRTKRKLAAAGKKSGKSEGENAKSR
ncbi:hypothetical protein HYV83_04835 [Candidatus Woesearchaeota archaeon]|nr:hypothetical protein [Candidatus Woesearchaeota archaeon]